MDENLMWIILTGMVLVFLDRWGARMAVAYRAKDQEDTPQ